MSNEKETVKDKYDEAVAYLQAHPEEIYKAWEKPYEHTSGCLFQFYGQGSLTRTGTGIAFGDRTRGVGCLTEIRTGYIASDKNLQAIAFDPDLTNEIRADARIPLSPEKDKPCTIQPHHLPLFAEYRRKLDAARAKAAGKEATV